MNTITKTQFSILLLYIEFSFFSPHWIFSLYKRSMGIFLFPWGRRPVAELKVHMGLLTPQQMGETLWTWPREDVPWAPSLLQCCLDKGGPWEHLHLRRTDEQQLSLPRGCAGSIPPWAAWSDPVADTARSNVLHHAPPELSPRLHNSVAPWSFELSRCSVLMMVSLSLTLREKYLTFPFYYIFITIFYLASIFNINQLESAEEPFQVCLMEQIPKRHFFLPSAHCSCWLLFPCDSW